MDVDQLARPLEDAEDLAGVRAVGVARERTGRLGEMPIPWEDVKRDLGLAAAVASPASDGLFLRRRGGVGSRCRHRRCGRWWRTCRRSTP